MSVSISEKEYEQFQLLKKIFLHANPEKLGIYFICGESGPKDNMGLPEGILVCPSSGLDGFAMYSKSKEYDAPGW